MEEGMALNFIGAFHSKSTGRITIQKTSEDAASFGPELVPEFKRVIQYFFIHRIGVLFGGSQQMFQCSDSRLRTIIKRR